MESYRPRLYPARRAREKGLSVLQRRSLSRECLLRIKQDSSRQKTKKGQRCSFHKPPRHSDENYKAQRRYANTVTSSASASRTTTQPSTFVHKRSLSHQELRKIHGGRTPQPSSKSGPTTSPPSQATLLVGSNPNPPTYMFAVASKWKQEHPASCYGGQWSVAALHRPLASTTSR